ncbi:MAG TPA: phospholipid-binding protein [Porticoccaceae bacterium]|jgi:osmotically-inducible protein OsmY|nr:phospholipid-binding protein [Porticoccaceae bacterium]
MRQLTMVMSLVFLLAGCATVINKVVKEPIDPDKAGRTVGEEIDDNKIKTYIAVNLKKADPELDRAHINIAVFKGLVLLSGEITNANLKVLAGDVARDLRGVRQVYNEIQVRGNSSIISRTNDTIISGKIITKFAFKKDLPFNNLTVITEDSVVYLLGTVRTSTGDAAVDIARNTSGVEKVVKCLEYVD